MLSIENFKLRIRAYLSGAALYGVALGIYAILPYYQGFISKTPIALPAMGPSIDPVIRAILFIIGNNTQSVLIHLYVAYLMFGLLWFLFYKKARTETRTFIFWCTIKKIVVGVGGFFREKKIGIPEPEISLEEKLTTLFFLVKFFYIPMMLNFLFGNISVFLFNGSSLVGGWQSIVDPLRVAYIALLYFILTIDTSYFVLGYLFEFASWKNEVRSVEPTVLGWVVALACYPPFNAVTTQILGWGSNDYSQFFNPTVMIIAAALSITLMSIYVWATIALGLKSSNLTNRGIVARGPYAYVRHPAYISKNLSWLIMGLPIIAVSPIAAFSIIAWASIYGMRALTEERHLMCDPDYQEYCKKVPYRFIPGVV